MIIGPLGFALPWMLTALIALPVLWLILRAIPPAPVRRLFPAVALLLGLRDDDSVSDRTPWWLLLLRMLAVAAVIIGLAGPVLNPADKSSGNGPLLLVLDATWASARDWQGQRDLAEGLLAEAHRAGRTAAVLRLTDPEPPMFQSADIWRSRLAGLTPLAWEPDGKAAQDALAATTEPRFDTLWLSDGLARETRDTLLTTLESHGTVQIYESPRAILGLLPAAYLDGAIQLTARRASAGQARDIMVQAHGLDPAGNATVLASLPITFGATDTEATAALSLPAELRARVTRFEIDGARSAAAVAVSDDSLRRREVALIAGREDREGLELLSPLHYLHKALIASVDILDGALPEILPANPDVIVLADIADLADAESTALQQWVEKGGLLLRFAGPRLATSDISRREEHPLMPVRLRQGGRTVGGAMSWGEPKSLAAFAKHSPFSGLRLPADVAISAQVLAQPDPTLADRVIAQLADGTPLVTRKKLGQGQVVLFHVTANAEWSTLPLSGLFVEMLDRLAVSSAATTPEPGELAGTLWQPEQVLDAFGALTDAGNLPGVPGENLLTDPLSPDLRPGIYSGDDRALSRNVMSPDRHLTPVSWPARVAVQGLDRAAELPLAGWLLALALALLAADVLASLALAGRLRGPRATATMIALLALGTPQHARADDTFAVNATAEMVLAHVITGDRALDDTAQAGLLGLSETLFFRTSVEPGTPMAVNLETDELAFFPLLYWPITPDQPQPSTEAYGRLNAYLRGGGMILFDTRDADIARFGSSSPNGRKLQQLAAPLDIPPLEPVPSDHVLTRTFYLLQDFPGRHTGRHTGRDVWVESAPPGAEQVEGMPFRNLNDGVSPVVIGGNDWAAAWAIDNRGSPLFPIGRGFAGERQRELAYRFGVNLVMHVLTGNYKSDQVHVPALLERLGQ